LGVPVRSQGNAWIVRGGALRESDRVLDAKNSGTALRLSMGLLAAQPFFSVLTGDASLRRRPLHRVIEPLRALGADLAARDQDRLAPVAIRGQRLRGASVRTPVASAQVKSALLLAAIQAHGDSSIEEPGPTRDHTERLLPRFGAPVTAENGRILVRGPASLEGIEARVPGDFSAAAFLWAAAAIVPRSDVTVRAVGVNPTRRAFLDLLARAGAQVEEIDPRDESGEPVADVRVRAGALAPIRIDAEDARGMIDELPLAAVLAAFAKGESVIRGAEELRVKESDRIATVAAGLRAIGVECEERPDGWVIQGTGAPRGGSVVSEGDHRIAMAFLVAGLRAKDGVRVEGVEAAAVSDPGFLPRLKGLLR
ncbi:MAG TPA: 3-phosphoshikimate 1-carboxyvinyltransferase, partial [Candidatus Eisenbacteria bacterium]|nr:3-phosphoshikimate 1-carboxyvinyltransferase [Candidatus Eisenbacteria bacterium]